MIWIVVGGALIVLGLADIFLTVLNYDGFSFLASRLYRYLWTAARTCVRVLPERLAGGVLSVAAPAMLPATVAVWLALEVIGFALIYHVGMVDGAFTAPAGHNPSFGQALYLSGVTIATLGYGDITPQQPLYQALTVGESLTGFAILTLTISYVLGAFGVLNRLSILSDTLRHHAADPTDPASLLDRHVLHGEPRGLEALLERIHDGLQSYDEGLRRYPVVYYFHARQLTRSMPYVVAVVGYLVSALRWGLPGSHALRDDPWLLALVDQYDSLVQRIQRSFVGGALDEPPPALELHEFVLAYGSTGKDGWVDDFRELEERTARQFSLAGGDRDAGDTYRRYRDWLPFAHRRLDFLARAAQDLGYDVSGIGGDASAAARGGSSDAGP